MAKITFNLPESIALSAQGIEFNVDASTFHADALEGIFVYGVRRWFQDSINSQAHTFRKAKEAGEVSGEFDTQAAFAARLESAVSGILSAPRASTSQPAFSPLDDATYAIAVEIKAKLKPLSDAWMASKGLATNERKAVILSAVASLPDATRAKILSAAQVRIDALAALAL